MNNISTSVGHWVVSEGCPQDVCRTGPSELNIRRYRDILETSAGGILKTSVGDVLWRYIEDHMGTSVSSVMGRLQDVLGKSFCQVGTCNSPFSNCTIKYETFTFESKSGASGFVCLYLLKYSSYSRSKNILH